jgi:hypothetical protein
MRDEGGGMKIRDEGCGMRDEKEKAFNLLNHSFPDSSLIPHPSSLKNVRA